MAYKKKTWVSNEIIKKDALNNIEDGIEAVENSIPKKTSQLENDSGFITEHQDLSSYAKKNELHDHNNKNVLDQISSAKIQAWDNAAVNNNNGSTVDLSNYATKDELHNHSNLSILDQISSAKIQVWDSSLKQSDLNNYVTKDELSDYAPGESIKHVFITEEEFNKLSKEEQDSEDTLYIITDAASATIDLSNYVTKDELSDYTPGESIKHVFITEAEFNKLSKEEQGSEDTLYIITDAESSTIDLNNYITKSDAGNYVTKNDASNYVTQDVAWQKYKLTNDDGEIKYITTNDLDIMKMEPGNYACVASRFINPPLPENDGYVDLTIRANTNSTGTRYIYIMHYVYHGRTFVGYKHHEHEYIHWEEVTEKSLPVQEFIDTEVNRIMKRLRKYHTSRNIGFITDTHYVKGARGKNSRRGLEHIKNCISICGNGAADMIIHGGDIINGGYSSLYALQTQLLDTNHAMLNSPVPVFPCKGNHDSGLVWSITSGEEKTKFDDIYITNKEWHNLVANRFIEKYGFVGDSNNPYNTYCYYDFDDIKLRCIMLDTEDLEKEHLTDADGNIVLDEEDGSMVFRIGQKQLDWLCNEALKFKNEDGWSVMLFSHVTIYSPYTENATRITNGKFIHNILKAFKNHTSYSSSNDDVSVQCDFTGTNHKVIAGVAGHYHDDMLLVKDGILYVTCKQSRCDYLTCTDPTDNDLYRAIGDAEHEDAWTILTVDPSERRVVLTRFGSGRSYEQALNLDELPDTTIFPGSSGNGNNDTI